MINTHVLNRGGAAFVARLMFWPVGRLSDSLKQPNVKDSILYVSCRREAADYDCLVSDFSGGTMTNAPNIKVSEEATDRQGHERLVLILIEVPLPNPKTRMKAYDFHSLVWERKHEDRWNAKMTISRADFQRGAVHARWVSRVHSLQAEEGRAIIQVGEDGTPNEAGVVRTTYSWREWDLIGNKEIRTLRICNSPFDDFETPKEGSKQLQ